MAATNQQIEQINSWIRTANGGGGEGPPGPEGKEGKAGKEGKEGLKGEKGEKGTGSEITYTAGEGLELSGAAFKIKAKGVTAAMLKEGELTRPYLKVEGAGAAGKVLGYTASGSGLEWVAGGGSSYTAKAAGGLELSGTEFLVEAKGVTDAMLKETYALLAGRSGGQKLIGGTAASNALTLESTSNATKGKILFGTSAYNDSTNLLGIGTASPTAIIQGEGKKPAEVAGETATTAPVVLKAIGPAGGNTSIAGLGVGGVGSAVTIQSGPGGEANKAKEGSIGGAGGPFALTAAAGANAAVAGEGENEGGEGGSFALTSGAGGKAQGSTSGRQAGGPAGVFKLVGAPGGTATVGTGENRAGKGANAQLEGGVGGNAANGSANYGGEGGNVFIAAGLGGTGSTEAGKAGTIKLTGATLLNKALGLWGHAAPATQPVAIANPTTLLEVAAFCKSLNETVVKNYGLTA